MELPIEFSVRMKDLLGDEYDDYVRSLEGPVHKALRLNPQKADEAQLLDLLKETFGDVFEPVAWEPTGFYYPQAESIRPGGHLLHEIGAYYIQEPSAMKPVTLLDIKPGERVLDLCAAPGGKTTQIAAYMQGRGLLVCNEFVPSRAKILSRNIERMGVGNAIVLNESPDKLAEKLPSFFDKILVDAPCSGEGMFRKNEEEAVSEWSPENVRMCAARQAQILDCAALMLMPGGSMVYSTCTFSREEDEDCIAAFLERHPDFSLTGMEKLFPHKIRGEGHFMAVLVKEDKNAGRFKVYSPDIRVEPKTGRDKGKGKDKSRTEALEDFISRMFAGSPGAYDPDRIRERLALFGDNLYLLPQGSPNLTGLKTERAGLQLGTFKKEGKGERFEPAHAWALALRADEVIKMVDITIEEGKSYIQGMTIDVRDRLAGEDAKDKGFVLVTCMGLSLGFGKLVNGVIKNCYPKGLRKNL